MFGIRYILISAILFSTATLFWSLNLFAAYRASGTFNLSNVLVVLAFLALTGVYWAIYFRRKAAPTTSQQSGTE